MKLKDGECTLTVTVKIDEFHLLSIKVIILEIH